MTNRDPKADPLIESTDQNEKKIRQKVVTRLNHLYLIRTNLNKEDTSQNEGKNLSFFFWNEKSVRKNTMD